MSIGQACMQRLSCIHPYGMLLLHASRTVPTLLQTIYSAARQATCASPHLVPALTLAPMLPLDVEHGVKQMGLIATPT